MIAEGGEEAQGAERTLQMTREAVERRLAEYVAKYSIYHNIVLVAPERHGARRSFLAVGHLPCAGIR